jgi:hypothetical protein
MAAETAFLQAIASHLSAPGRLTPTPVRMGVSEPTAASELPAVVLWLEEVHRLGGGLGERAAMITDGALPVTARIDLANPVLSDEPTFQLLSADNRTLVLPHGGWVKADGTRGLLSSADLQVIVIGATRSVVNAAPGANEVRPDAAVGTLLFGSPLPNAGMVQATYVLGQWERRVMSIAGNLRIEVRAGNVADAEALSAAVMDALEANLPRGMRKVVLGQVSAVVLPLPGGLAGMRSRSLAYTFEYEHEINQPDSSGGVIRRIPITTRVAATSIEVDTGAIITTVFSEVDQ